MFYGKLVAGLIGLLVAGPFGLVIGLFIGHLFDRGLHKTLQFASPENIAKIKNSFFETTFLLLGFIAKSDGRISQKEVDHTESIIAQMGLTAEQRQRAIDLFRRGSAADFQLEPVVSQFVETCGSARQLHQTILVFLISLAQADQRLDEAEHTALRRIALLLGFSGGQLEQLLRMAQAQGHFHGGAGAGTGGSYTSSADSLAQAYAALGVDPSVNDKDLKRAYRKLMSEHHPDKLIAQGMPEDMVKLATEKSQEIQSAYELVKKSRG